MSEIDPPFVIAIGASGSEGLSDMMTLLALLPKPVEAIILAVLHRRFHKRRRSWRPRPTCPARWKPGRIA